MADAPLYKPGDSGAEITTLQQTLRKKGFDLQVTGTYDYATTQTIMYAQDQSGLAVTGNVDLQTFNTIASLPDAGSSPIGTASPPTISVISKNMKPWMWAALAGVGVTGLAVVAVAVTRKK